MIYKSAALTACAVLACLQPPQACARQPLETETARLPEKGHGDIQYEFEHATSEDGRDIAMPLVLEYGLSDRLKVVVEPDLYASVKPKGAAGMHGFGDTEAKLVYRIADETPTSPAFAIAGEVKFPTGKKPDLTSGKLDYRVFGIVSRRWGDFDLHANIGYTLVGSPAGENLPNVLDYSAAAEYVLSDSLSLVGEILGSSPLGGGGGPPPAPGSNAEAEGTVVTGLLGGIYKIGPRAELALAGTYDTSKTFLLRAGITLKF